MSDSIALKSRLTTLFQNRTSDQKIMNLFLTAGFPDQESSAELILGLEKNGADIIELGMPFSDPLADGPTIQYSSNVAIENGTNLQTVFDIVKKVRESSEIPIVLMGYINPILRYGISAFFDDAAKAGVDGFILPDVPVEEADEVEQYCKKYGLDLIYLVAPNTTDERMKLIDEKSTGFIYCVSVTGVTGARDGGEVARSVEKFINRVNSNISKNPVLVGFGIKNHDNAVTISKKLDGFVVGSALINNIKENYPNNGWKEKLYSFVHELKFGK